MTKRQVLLVLPACFMAITLACTDSSSEQRLLKAIEQQQQVMQESNRLIEEQNQLIKEQQMRDAEWLSAFEEEDTIAEDIEELDGLTSRLEALQGQPVGLVTPPRRGDICGRSIPMQNYLLDQHNTRFCRAVDIGELYRQESMVLARRVPELRPTDFADLPNLKHLELLHDGPLLPLRSGFFVHLGGLEYLELNDFSGVLNYDFSLPLPVLEHLVIKSVVLLPERTELEERRGTPEPLLVADCCGPLPSGLKTLEVQVGGAGWGRVGIALPESLPASLQVLDIGAKCLAESSKDALMHLTELVDLKLPQYPCDYDGTDDRKVILVANSELASRYRNLDAYIVLGQDQV